MDMHTLDYLPQAQPKHNFDKSSRLLNPAEFKYVFDLPLAKVHSSSFIVFVKNNTKCKPRLGLAITKRKIKSAVQRNRIKRCTRVAFINKAIGAFDLVLIVKKTPDFDMLFAELDSLFEQIKRRFPAQ